MPADRRHGVTRLVRQRITTLVLLAASSLTLAWPFLGGAGDPDTSLESIDHLAGEWSSTGAFRLDGAYETTSHELTDRTIPIWGSWTPEGRGTSQLTSPWYPSSSELVVGRAGQLRNDSFVEVEWRDGRESARRRLPDAVIGETVRFVDLDVPDRGQVRVLAVSVGPDWVGVTPPVRLDVDQRAGIVGIAEVAAASTAAAVLVFLPGLLLRERLRRRPSGDRRGRPWSRWLSEVDVAVVLVGPGACAVVSLGIWAVAARVDPRIAGSLVVAAAFASMALATWRIERPLLDRRELLVAACIASLLIAGTGRLMWSAGPEGELFGGTISRAYEIGARSDGRIPFHVIQLVGQAQGPSSDLARELYSPWSFSARAPIARLAAAPIVFASGAQPLAAAPEAPWRIFDDQGFMAFRLVSLALGATSVWAVGSLAATVAGRRAARFAVALFALTPFLLHEMLFPWPKLVMATAVLAAAQALWRRRNASAGALMGAAFLLHPAALLFVPTFGLLLLLRTSPPLRRCVLDGCRFVGALAAVYLTWRVVNLGQFEQDSFFDYIRMADGALATDSGDWLRSRVELIENTFVPGHQWWSRREAADLNPLSGHAAPPGVRWHLQYWTVAPFAAGLLAAPAIVAGVLAAIRRHAAVVAIVLLAPLVTFVPYWGFTSTGAMREALHPWLCGLAVVAGVGLASLLERAGHAQRVVTWLVRLSAGRTVETLAMLVVPATSAGALLRPTAGAADAIALVTVLAGLGALTSAGWRGASTPDDDAPSADQALRNLAATDV